MLIATLQSFSAAFISAIFIAIAATIVLVFTVVLFPALAISRFARAITRKCAQKIGIVSGDATANATANAGENYAAFPTDPYTGQPQILPGMGFRREMGVDGNDHDSMDALLENPSPLLRDHEQFCAADVAATAGANANANACDQSTSALGTPLHKNVPQTRYRTQLAKQSMGAAQILRERPLHCISPLSALDYALYSQYRAINSLEPNLILDKREFPAYRYRGQNAGTYEAKTKQPVSFTSGAYSSSDVRPIIRRSEVAFVQKQADARADASNREDFTTKREKANTIIGWFARAGNNPKFANFSADLNQQSNIVEYEDALGLYARGKLTLDNLMRVL